MATQQEGSKRRTAPQEIPGPRITLAGAALCILYLGVPVAIVGNLADLLFQLLFGWCIGLWCAI